MAAILQYHQIADVSAQLDPKGLAVPPRMFEQQMEYLYRARFRCLTLQDVISSRLSGKRLPPRTFAITFDDGFKDLHDVVWPILDRFGFTATIFLVVGRVSMTNAWQGEESHAPLLSWSEVAQMARAGFTFGSHTITHPWLTTLDDESARREIGTSRLILEDQIGLPVDFFAYPYSSSDRRIRTIAEQSGYMAACCGDRGRWNPYNVWRAQILHADGMPAFHVKAGGLYDHWTWVREESPLARLRPPLSAVLRHPSRLPVQPARTPQIAPSDTIPVSNLSLSQANSTRPQNG